MAIITTVLIKRRAKRGRPRKSEAKTRLSAMPVFVARDPQGIKIFITRPKLTVMGLWEGTPLNGFRAMEPRTFVVKFRNARLPNRGGMLETRMGL
jgi:hypothetical protein